MNPNDEFELRLDAVLLNDECPFCNELMIEGRCYICGHDPSSRNAKAQTDPTL